MSRCKRVIAFPTRFYGRPERVPEALRRVSHTTPWCTVDGLTNHGGTHSKYRTENQDCLFLGMDDTRSVLCAGVVDGAGGTAGARLTSRMASGMLLDRLTGGMQMVNAFAHANGLVTWRNTQLRQDGAATAAVIRVSRDGALEIGAIGDAKIMTFRRRRILRPLCTREQNFARRVYDQTDFPWMYFNHPLLSSITAYLGGSARNEQSESGVFLNGIACRRDLLVLGSDGLWDNVTEYEAWQIVRQHGRDSRALCDALFTLAMSRNNSGCKLVTAHWDQHREINLRPARDNLTIVVVLLTA